MNAWSFAATTSVESSRVDLVIADRQGIPRQSMSLQKTYSNDSLNELQPSIRPLASLDGPRKHARRISLPASGRQQGQASSSSKVVNGDASNEDEHVDISAYQAERRRFREALGSSSKVAGSSPSKRRSSAPSGSNGAIRKGIVKRPSPNFEDIEGDDESDEDDDDALHSAFNLSLNYSAGASGDVGRDDEDDTSTDASNSDRHPFDWDVAKKRGNVVGMTTIRPNPISRSRSQRRLDEVNGGAKDGNGAPDTPKLKKQELEPEGVTSVASALKPPQNLTSRANGSASPATNSRLSPSGAEPMTMAAKRRSVKLTRKRFLPTISLEASIIIAGGIFACSRLRQYEDEAISQQMYGLFAVLVTSTLFCLLRPSNEFGAIWATDERNYRPCGDDGAICGLMLGPLLAVTSLFTSLAEQQILRPASGDSLPAPPWQIEAPWPILGSRTVSHTTLNALALSRSSLLSLQSLTSTTMLCHLLATKYIRRPSAFPKSNWRKLWSFIKFSTTLSLLLVLLQEAFRHYNIPIWTDLTRGEIFSATLFYQNNLYTISRLARKSFTLGELGIVATVGVTLTLEVLNLTSAKMFPGSTDYIKTFRRPTPLLIFQLALVVGTFMVGFLLSPLLYLSRHLAQKPVHRLRWPHKRDLHRRLLAGFFYAFTALYVVGVLGFWVWWLLGKRNPWIWTFKFVLSGTHWWSRPALVAYWLALVSISISGWQAIVMSSAKRLRVRPAGANSNGQQVQSAQARAKGIQSGVAMNGAAEKSTLLRGSSPNVTGSGGESTTAPNGTLAFPKKAAYLSLNARRKFFHALAVFLFTPGIAFDPAFSHLAFSLAFSAFIFAEYIRYYALYPFGAVLHVFMSEFTDHKDSGPVILSHFYLLTGCASPLWIEGVRSIPSKILIHGSESLQDVNSSWLAWLSHKKTTSLLTPHSKLDKVDISMFIGVLTLGVGDALASVVGRRYGRICWPLSSKTLEGSIAFMTSIFGSAMLLRAMGWCAPFPVSLLSPLISY